jgi:hypothetical protein
MSKWRIELYNGRVLDLSSVPLTEDLEAAEEAWAGGIADFGDFAAPYLAQQMRGYNIYYSGLKSLLREQLGDAFVMYRSIAPEEWEEWKHGIVQDLRSFTFHYELACRWKKFAGHRDKKREVMRAVVSPQAVVLRGRREEAELVLDGQWVQASNVRLVTRMRIVSSH